MSALQSSQALSQPNSSRDIIRQIVVILATLATISINILANALPFNGQNTGDISDRFLVYFVPAGYVFAIWGVIYVGWIAFSIYQALPAQRANQLLRDISGWYLVSAVANSFWLVCWHYNWFGLSLVVMLALLGSLIMIYRRLAAEGTARSRAELWAVHAPFSVYLAWVSVATIANATDVLYLTGWNGFGISGPMWAVIMLGVATGLGLLFSFWRADVGFVAVLVWAFVGIAVKHSDVQLVMVAALAAAAVVGLSLLITIPRVRRSRRQASAAQLS